MSGADATPTPALCRLCRRPIPRAATKCPYCGARRVWSAREGTRRLPRPVWASGLKIAAFATAIAAVIVLVVVWLWVLREVKAPISSADTATKPAGPLIPAECASLASELTAPSAAGARMTPVLRDRIRQCFQRR